MRAARRAGQAIYYRLMSLFWRKSFTPSIINVEFPNCQFRFFVGNAQAADWYDPPKPHAMTEYRWVLDNVDFDGQNVIDAGAHHGHYSLLFAKAQPNAARIRAVEPLPANCTLIELNAVLNAASIEIEEAAISPSRGVSKLVPRSNARLFPGVGIEVKTLQLSDIMTEASIVKLDIEGTEFEILPSQLDDMPGVHTWIVEVHPNYGDVHSLASEFLDRGYSANYLDRGLNSVQPYRPDSHISSSTSLFFQRS